MNTSFTIDHKWFWVAALGAFKVGLGLFALCFVGFTSLLSVIYLGALFMVSGVAEVLYAILHRRDGDLIYHASFGVLSALAGYLMFINPIENLFFMTLVIAFLLMLSGVISLLASFFERFPRWGWFALNGLIAVAASALILRDPLHATTWLLGTLVGVEMIFSGLAWMSLGLHGRRLSLSH